MEKNNFMKYFFIFYCVLMSGLLVWVGLEIHERNEKLDDDPCKYYEEHCTFVPKDTTRVTIDINNSKIDDIANYLVN